MNMRIAGGKKENGIVIGNSFDKYNSKNPIVNWMMNGFESALTDLVKTSHPQTIHEIGCGEGYWVLRWKKQGYAARGCDFSKDVIKLAYENANAQGVTPFIFQQKNIYDLDASQDIAELVVCCEVLEHLEAPQAALEALQRVVSRHLIISVPNEPLWRILNLVRGKYIRHLGNTPGHIQHWSKNDLIKLVSQYFTVVEIKNPLPWTMLLCSSSRPS